MEDNNIKTEIKALFSRMGKQEGMFEALYRSVASSFGISTCEMWIYYFLLIEQDGVTQQTICSQMSFKKQTVNSAVSKLVKEGMLRLTAMNENNKSKTLSLSPKGAEFANNTVNSLLNAELKAAQKFGKLKLNSLCMLRDEYLDVLQNEFIKEGLLNNSKDI